MAGPLTATVDVGGPFKIETKPYNIAAKVVLAAADKPSPPILVPAPKPTETKAVAAPETHKADLAEPEPVTAKAEEASATESKSGSWVILSALVGLGVVAAGFAVYKKSV